MQHWLDEMVLPEAWQDLRGFAASDTDRRDRFTEELQRELGVDHELAAVGWRVVATAWARDDLLLALDDGSAAIVHLTFTSTPPERPPWPETVTAASRRSLDDLFRMRD